MAKRLQIKGEIFKIEDLESITLRDIFAFDSQVALVRQKDPAFPDITWSDVQEVGQAMEGKSQEEAARVPRSYLFTAATLWLTTRNGGKPLTFDEVLDLDMEKEVIDLPDPKDKANPTQRPSKSPRASGVAASKAPASEK